MLEGLPREVAVFADTHKLTPSERLVVAALARGVARSQIARELRVKENTVKTTVRKLLNRTRHANLDDVLRSLLKGLHQNV